MFRRLLSAPKISYLKLRFGPSSLNIHRSARLYPSSRVELNYRAPRVLNIGARTIVMGHLVNFGHAGRISIGEDCFIGPGSRIWAATSISIGNRILISHNVNIFDSMTHPLNHVERHQQYLSIYQGNHPSQIDLEEEPVTLEDDCWIGANAIILKGVTIGERSVVGAGAVVTSDVPANSVVAGNPAKLIRSLSDPL